MASRSIRIVERSRTRRVSYQLAGEELSAPRPQLIGKAYVVSAQEAAAAEQSETDLLLHQLHDLVAQLREAVGRPRLDL